MTDVTVALALHVVAVVLWIGGVGLVTTALLPAVRETIPPAEQLAFFERIERRFARQARVTTLLAGGSGFYMAERMDLWSGLGSPAFWWLWAMIVTWSIFTLMLFVLEPLVLDRWLHARAARDPHGTMRLLQRLHIGLLTLSLITVFGAAAGSHGLTFFG